jgi:hypothetical protein
LEPSSSLRTRQRFEGNLVRVGATNSVKTLTSILSLEKGEAGFCTVRRANGLDGGKSQTSNPKRD